MTIVTDERLMAYADGELPPEEMRALEIMIAEDPELAARIEPFKATGSPLAGLFDPVLKQPIPPRLLETIDAARLATAQASRRRHAAPGTATRVGIFDAVVIGWLTQGFKLTQAFALSALLLAGGAAGWTAREHWHEADPASRIAAASGEQLMASGALAAALDGTLSGAAAHGITPTATYAGKDGGYCRQYRYETAAMPSYTGVACRTTDAAGWRIAVHTELPPEVNASKDRIETASGPATAALDAMLDRLVQGDALLPDAEQKLITDGWSQPAGR